MSGCAYKFSNFEANSNHVNVQEFIHNSLDDVLPKFRQCAKYNTDKIFYLTFCTLLMILHKISKSVQMRMGQYKKYVFKLN